MRIPPLVAAHHIIVDRDVVQAVIKAQVAALAAEVGGAIPHDPGLLDEVTDLVEQPTAIRGNFAEAFLAVAKDVLITVMKKHQRYFPIRKEQGKQGNKETGTAGHLFPCLLDLLPHFDHGAQRQREDAEGLRSRQRRCLSGARYADAEYFFKADTAHKLDYFTPRLATLTFQEKLGSMLDKARRSGATRAAARPDARPERSRPGDHVRRCELGGERSGRRRWSSK